MIEQNVRPKGLKQSNRITPVQLMVVGYLFFAILGSFILSLPISLQPGVSISYIDALFTATSAISVTGLTTVTTHETFSNFGLIILLIYFQIGGIGIMTLGALLYIFMGSKIGLRNRMLIRVDQNQNSLEGLVYLMIFIFKIAIILESIAALILTSHFFFNYGYELKTAFKLGVFHAISGFTNAGFDLFGNSLQGFPQDYIIHATIGIMIFLGAIGFPVLMELRNWVHDRKIRFSLFFKITTFTYLILLALGAVVVLAFELNQSLAGMPWHQKLSVALFQSVTTRSGGLSTFDVSQFGIATTLFFCMLMFIGGSPSSCGGGIRTTTFAVILMSLYAFWRGREHVQIFKRELHSTDIHRAYAIFTLAVVMVFFATLTVQQLEQFPMHLVLFDVCSAFGTTGLSLGITGDLSTPSKLILIVLMFIGRIGFLAFLLLPQRPTRKQKVHFVKERIIVG